MLSFSLNSQALSYLSVFFHLDDHRRHLRRGRHLVEEVHHPNRSGMVASCLFHFRHLAHRHSRSRFGNQSWVKAVSLRSYRDPCLFVGFESC